MDCIYTFWFIDRHLKNVMHSLGWKMQESFQSNLLFETDVNGARIEPFVPITLFKSLGIFLKIPFILKRLTLRNKFCWESNEKSLPLSIELLSIANSQSRKESNRKLHIEHSDLKSYWRIDISKCIRFIILFDWDSLPVVITISLCTSLNLITMI